MITIDTSALIAYLGEQDRSHDAITAILDDDPGPFLIPVAVLAEMTYMIERDFAMHLEDAFLQDLQDGEYSLYCEGYDLARIRALIQRYAAMPLGFADAVTAVCAERHAGRLITLDRRHFDAVARGERTLIILP